MDRGTSQAAAVSDHPDHDPEAALALIRAAHREGGRCLSDREVIEFISRPIFILDGKQPVEWSGNGRKPKKRREEQSSERRRSLYHKLVRLRANHSLAADACKQQGAMTRVVVFKLFQMARDSGTADRHLVRDVQKLFASLPDRHKRRAPPGERQLRRLLREFLKMGMSA